MRRVAAVFVLLSSLVGGAVSGLSDRAPAPVIVVSQTHVFHAPLGMDQVVGSLGMEGFGGLGFDLAPRFAVGGYLEYRNWRVRLAVSGAASLSGAGACYAGAIDWFGFPYEVRTTYRIRFGAGGGLSVCYPLAGGGAAVVQPAVEGVANLQFRVIPNVIADVTFVAGFPTGLGGAVGFALAY